MTLSPENKKQIDPIIEKALDVVAMIDKCRINMKDLSAQDVETLLALADLRAAIFRAADVARSVRGR